MGQAPIPRRLALLGAALFASACSGEGARIERIHYLMAGEMDEAADGIWSVAGYDITAAGERSLYPTTDEGWRAVAESADDLAAVAEKLKTRDYALNDTDWVEISEGLVVAAARARKAAEAQDEQELFDAGGHVYRVCVSCHQAYAPDIVGAYAE